MTVPFSSEQFFSVFGRYNLAVWPAQIVLYALGMLVIGFAARGTRRSSMWASSILAALWLWSAVVYHLTFFRVINPIAAVFAAAFFLQAALVFRLGLLRSDLVFARSTGSRRIAGGIIVAYALIVYPFLNFALGHGYPRMPTFGLPCPTTIFTFGILLFAAPNVPRAVFVIPALWAVVGTAAALTFGLREDFGLPVAGVVSIALILARPRTVETRD